MAKQASGSLRRSRGSSGTSIVCSPIGEIEVEEDRSHDAEGCAEQAQSCGRERRSGSTRPSGDFSAMIAGQARKRWQAARPSGRRQSPATSRDLVDAGRQEQEGRGKGGRRGPQDRCAGSMLCALEGCRWCDGDERRRGRLHCQVGAFGKSRGRGGHRARGAGGGGRRGRVSPGRRRLPSGLQAGGQFGHSQAKVAGKMRRR